MRISDWSSDVCSSDLGFRLIGPPLFGRGHDLFAPHAVEHLGKGGLIRVGEAGPRRFDHQRLRMAMEGSDDDLLHHMLDCAVLFDDLLAAISEGVNDAIGQQNAQEGANERRSEEHTSELQSLMRISYAVFCLKKKIRIYNTQYS